LQGAKQCQTKCKAHCDNGVGNGPDCRPGRARFNNDDVGGVPGAPGARGGGAQGTEYNTRNKGDNTVVNPDLVFQGDLAGTFHKTVCHDTCESESDRACAKAPSKAKSAPKTVYTPCEVDVSVFLSVCFF
jgi:hypothetical protein